MHCQIEMNRIIDGCILIETEMNSCSFVCNISKHRRTLRVLHFANCNIDQRLSMCYDFLDAQNMRLLIVNVKCIAFVKQYDWYHFIWFDSIRFCFDSVSMRLCVKCMSIPDIMYAFRQSFKWMTTEKLSNMQFAIRFESFAPKLIIIYGIFN